MTSQNDKTYTHNVFHFNLLKLTYAKLEKLILLLILIVD